jgi:hypothetical protein
MSWPSAGVESLTRRPLCRETNVCNGSRAVYHSQCIFPVVGDRRGQPYAAGTRLEGVIHTLHVRRLFDRRLPVVCPPG